MLLFIQACIVHEDNDIGTASASTGSCPNNASNLNASKLNNKSVEYNLPEDQFLHLMQNIQKM